MNTERLYEFLVLSRVLNYSRAAKALYISQPILTRHIQALEAELGVPLLKRTTHGVALTEAGRLLSNQTEGLLEKCDRALGLTRVRNMPVKGRVRIACELEISYASQIREFTHKFMERYPDIELDFEVVAENTPPSLCARCDLVFTPCKYAQPPAGVVRRLIFSHGTYAVLPPGHKLMTKSLIALHQLAGETLIVPYAWEPFGPYARNWLLVEKSTRGRIGCIKAPNLMTALFLVSTGKGIVIAPRHVRNMLTKDCFVVGISDRDCRFNEYVYYNEATDNGAARLFYEEFRAEYIRD